MTYEVVNMSYEVATGSYEVVKASCEVVKSNYEVKRMTCEVANMTYDVATTTCEVATDTCKNKNNNTLTTTAILTSVSTFRFHAIATLQPKKRKELSLSAYPRFIDTFVHFDNAVKKEEKAPLTKIKTPTHNRPDKKSIKLASVVYDTNCK